MKVVLSIHTKTLEMRMTLLKFGCIKAQKMTVQRKRKGNRCEGGDLG